jgi:hypothetical protein
MSPRGPYMVGGHRVPRATAQGRDSTLADLIGPRVIYAPNEPRSQFNVVVRGRDSKGEGGYSRRLRRVGFAGAVWGRRRGIEGGWFAGVEKLIGEHECCHDQEAVVGGAAQVAAQLIDFNADVVAEGFDAGFFAIAAHEAIAPAHQRYSDLAHAGCYLLGIVLQNGVQ